jgi:iron complex transport system substrate-binding protein
MKTKSTLIPLLLACCLILSPLLLATGCSTKAPVDGEKPSTADSTDPKPANEQTGTSYPLTMQNYDFDGTDYTDVDIVFEQTPQRVFGATQGPTETLLMLGLEDVIAGTANKTSEPVAEIADAYNRLNLVTADYATKEQVIACDPDMIIGRGALFTNGTWGITTTSEFKQLGITPWILTSSVNGSTIDDIYTDIRELGKIFDVQTRADAWADELEGRMSDLYARAKADGISEKPQTYLFLVKARSGNGYMVFSGPQTSQQEGALKPFGLTNAATEIRMDTVSAENILAFDPDAIFAINYTPGDTTETQAMIDDVKSNESLTTLPAVVNDAFYIIEYNDFFSYSFRTIDGIERLMQAMYPQTFK